MEILKKELGSQAQAPSGFCFQNFLVSFPFGLIPCPCEIPKDIKI